MKKIIISFLALSIAVGGYLIFHATSKSTLHVSSQLRAVTPTDMAKEADAILVGTFAKSSTRTEKDPDHGMLVFTDWQITPNEIWKGRVPEPLIVSMLGGTKGNTTVIAEKNPKINNGDKALIYLTYIQEKKEWIFYSPQQAILTLTGSSYHDAIGNAYASATLKSAVDTVSGIAQPAQPTQ